MIGRAFEYVLITRIRPEVFSTKDVLKNFQTLQGKICAGASFLNKVASLQPATSLKWRPRINVFFCKIFYFVNFLKYHFYGASPTVDFCDDDDDDDDDDDGLFL